MTPDSAFIRRLAPYNMIPNCEATLRERTGTKYTPSHFFQGRCTKSYAAFAGSEGRQCAVRVSRNSCAMHAAIHLQPLPEPEAEHDSYAHGDSRPTQKTGLIACCGSFCVSFLDSLKIKVVAPSSSSTMTTGHQKLLALVSSCCGARSCLFVCLETCASSLSKHAH